MKTGHTDAVSILKELNFSEELLELRRIILSTGLKEEIKWGGPLYTYEGNHVAGIAGFTKHFAIWFHQGALLKDQKKKLINAQEGKTKALRQWRMTSAADIDEKILVSYLKEAIANESKGRRITPDKPIRKAPKLPEELSAVLTKSKTLKAAFEKLTPGRQKEYAGYINEAKQVATKMSRIEKIKPLILEGLSLNAKYKKK